MENRQILEKINRATLRFLSPLSLEETYQAIVDEATALVNAKYGSLVLEQDGELERVYSTLPIARRIGLRRSGFTHQAFKTKRAFVRKSSDYGFKQSVGELGLNSIIFVPMISRNQAIGVLIINSEEEVDLSKRQLSTLKVFGALASLAIRKNQLYMETKEALELRDLFISMAAHELRTPLTTISGYTQLLRQKFKDSSTSEGRWVYELFRETNRLRDLLNDLLEINRIKTSKFQYHFQEVDLNTVLNRAVSNFEVSHPDRKLNFEDHSSGDSRIAVDFDKLLQVFGNLLENAAKFSGADKEIIIKVLDKKPYLAIQILDQGVGIPKEDIPKLFESFYRGSNIQYEEGMGLGLYLVKNIIEQHRGEVRVRSKVNQGTTIEILLPNLKYGRK